VDDLRETLGVATCCRRCEDTARDVLNGALGMAACACGGDD
jgi:bacterioferritin-associated ferredoxin